jgi:hypothetical protein
MKGIYLSSDGGGLTSQRFRSENRAHSEGPYLRQYSYVCTSKASKLGTCERRAFLSSFTATTMPLQSALFT